MRKDCCSDYTYEELENFVCKLKMKAEDAEFELELYRDHSRIMRRDNIQLKQSLEFNKRENKKAVEQLIVFLFPKLYEKYTCFKGVEKQLAIDHLDGAIGVMVDGGGKNIMQFYMQDGSVRNIDSSKKDWIMFY